MEEKLFELIKRAVREVLEEQKPIENKTTGAVGLKKASEFIGMSTSWIRKNQQRLNGYHEGTKLMFKMEDLQSYLDSKGANNEAIKNSVIKTIKVQKTNYRKIV